MRAICISIGDELLYGQTLDTNAHWLSQEFNQLGIRVIERFTIPDDFFIIQSTLRLAMQKANIITITGGLGPTLDDITKKALADFFHVPLIEDSEVWEDVKFYFAKRGRVWTDLNRNQASVPANCKALRNALGTAPGMYFIEDGCHIVSLPGVPFEMKYLFTERFVPVLREHIELPELLHAYFLTAGKGESLLAHELEDFEQSLPQEIKLAYLPHLGSVSLRLSMEANMQIEKDEFQMYANTLESRLRVLGDFVSRQKGESLIGYLVYLLKQKALTIGFAESCTGGKVSHLMTQIPGVSSIFRGSVVAYSNSVKQALLNVNFETLNIYGAVSENCVLEMVSGALSVLQSDIAIAISGIAGPEGGTEEKPVGTVWIAVGNSQRQEAKMYQFGGNREVIIERATQAAIFQAIRFIETY